jgi:hypothetical protein
VAVYFGGPPLLFWFGRDTKRLGVKRPNPRDQNRQVAYVIAITFWVQQTAQQTIDFTVTFVTVVTCEMNILIMREVQP